MENCWLPSFSIVQSPPCTSWQPVESQWMMNEPGKLCSCMTLVIFWVKALLMFSKSSDRCFTAFVPLRLTKPTRRSRDLAKDSVMVMCPPYCSRRWRANLITKASVAALTIRALMIPALMRKIIEMLTIEIQFTQNHTPMVTHVLVLHTHFSLLNNNILQ